MNSIVGDVGKTGGGDEGNAGGGTTTPGRQGKAGKSQFVGESVNVILHGEGRRRVF